MDKKPDKKKKEYQKYRDKKKKAKSISDTYDARPYPKGPDRKDLPGNK